jgi:hypothetical protein
MSMPEQSQMRDMREKAERACAVAAELTSVMKRHGEAHSFSVAGKGLVAFLAHYASHFENPCDTLEELMNEAHEAMHVMGMVKAPHDEEESLEAIPEEEFFHA